MHFFKVITQTNLTTLIISIVCITLLLIIKIHISERYAKKLPVPIPTELLIVS